MTIVQYKSVSVIANELIVAVDIYFQPERARRWAAIIQKGKDLKKLSPFELLNEDRRHPKIQIEQFKNWPDFKSTLFPFFKKELIGIAALDAREMTPVSGTVEDFVNFFLEHRVDSWLILRSSLMSLVSTHERNFAILRPCSP